MTEHNDHIQKTLLAYYKMFSGKGQAWRMETGKAYTIESVWAVFDFLTNFYKKYGHTMHEHARDRTKEMLRVIAYGYPGYSDIGGVLCGRAVFLEIKIPPDTQNPDQKKFQRNVEAAGGVYAIIDNKTPVEAQLRKCFVNTVPAAFR